MFKIAPIILYNLTPRIKKSSNIDIKFIVKLTDLTFVRNCEFLCVENDAKAVVSPLRPWKFRTLFLQAPNFIEMVGKFDK